MLDSDLLDDLSERTANEEYKKLVQQRQVSLEMLNSLPPYEQCAELEKKLERDGELTFERIFNSPTGLYMIKCFLKADYAVDKAIFVKDAEAYRSMRFENVRKKFAKLIYQRFVAGEHEHNLEFEKGASVFKIVADEKNKKNASSNALPVPLDPRDGRGSDAPSLNDRVRENSLQIGSDNNSIGVYGPIVRKVRDLVNRDLAPQNLFDEVVEQVMLDLHMDVFPRFRTSKFFRKYIRTQWIHTQPVTITDFKQLRVLGRGGFGAVYACAKKNSGAIYAMKCMDKRLVKSKNALDNILEERNVLTMLKSKFFTNLKYALQDEDQLVLIMDLMLGGDLKFQLLTAGKFSDIRSRFYAAEVLLGLEAVNKASIIYRDMKLENVLLDNHGHCRLSDLGLAVVTKVNIKGYAGTPGYTAPEMIRNKLYGTGADIFSFGVMLYRMLSGQKPFKGKGDQDLDNAVLNSKPPFGTDFSKEAVSLLTGLLQKRPDQRLGCGPRGFDEIKEHPFFETIDWGLLEAGYVDPPFVPSMESINAASAKEIGTFDSNKFKTTKLDDAFKKRLENFEFISGRGLQDEMVAVLEKADENTNFERFAVQPEPQVGLDEAPHLCCAIL